MRQAGSIVKKRKRYYIVYRTPEKRQKWEGGFRRRAEAQGRLTEILGQIQTATYCEPSAMTFAEFADVWLAGRVKIEANTGQGYESYLRRHVKPALGPLRLKDIRHSTIQNLIADLCQKKNECGQALSANTIKKIASMLGTIFRAACRSNLIRSNPAMDIELPKIIKARVQPPDKADALAIFEAAPNETRAIFIVDAMTGLRRGEILALQWGDVDWMNHELLVQRVIRKAKATDGVHKYQWVPVATTKGGRSRRVGLSPAMLEILRNLRAGPGAATADHDFIFERNGTFIDPEYFSKWIALPLIKSATKGRVKRFHDIRHLFTSMLIENGESPKYIQDQLGHASVNTTFDIYGHLMPQARQQATRKLERSLFGKNRLLEHLLEQSPKSGISKAVN